MKKCELQEIADKLADTYGNDRHFDEIEVDAADQVWAVWGTAVHAVLEKQPDNNFHEESFKVPVGNGFVTGQVDSYDMENGQRLEGSVCRF